MKLAMGEVFTPLKLASINNERKPVKRHCPYADNVLLNERYVGVEPPWNWEDRDLVQARESNSRNEGNLLHYESQP
jgi:hypothetical protein